MRRLLQIISALLLTSAAGATDSNNCRFALEVDKESYLPAEEIQVTMTQCDPDLEDFVAIYDVDVDPNETRGGHVTYLMWMRTCGSSYCSEPASSSTFMFGKGHNKHSWPLPKGSYKVHLLKKTGKKEFETYASSKMFMVEDREPKKIKKIEVGSV